MARQKKAYDTTELSFGRYKVYTELIRPKLSDTDLILGRISESISVQLQ